MPQLLNLEGTSIKAMDCLFFTNPSEINKVTPTLAITSADTNGAINIWLDDDMHFRCNAMRNRKSVDKQVYSDVSKAKAWAKKWLSEIKEASDKTTETKNCLGYALRFWHENPKYRLYYNSDHVINSPVKIQGGHWLPVEDYGYSYFSSAFKGLLTEEEENLLWCYFKNDVLMNELKKSEIL